MGWVRSRAPKAWKDNSLGWSETKAQETAKKSDQALKARWQTIDDSSRAAREIVCGLIAAGKNWNESRPAWPAEISRPGLLVDHSKNFSRYGRRSSSRLQAELSCLTSPQ